MKVLLILFSLFFQQSLLALDYAVEIKKSLSEFSKINNLSAMDQCDEPDPKIPKGCQNRYERLYRDRVLNISVGFGYFDHGTPNSYVHDVHMRNAFVQIITKKPCPPNLTACGFDRNPDDADKFFKEIINPWGKKHRVELSLTSGALSPDNSHNTNPSNLARQNQLCEQATEQFMNNVKKGDEVVLYVGHSRDGGGPDFCPPKLLKNGHRDYPFYRTKRPGHKRMLAALQEANSRGKPQEIIGMLSCFTSKHFEAPYSKISNRTGLIMSTEDTLSDNQLRNLLGSVDSVLAQRCEEGFAQSIKYGGQLKLKNMFSGVSK